MSHRPTAAAAERHVLHLHLQRPNAVQRAAILREVAPRERWAKLAKRTTAELDGRQRGCLATLLERHSARSAVIN
jgi:hypothetical protein